MNEHIQTILAWTPGWPEVLLVLLVALLLFGKRLPDAARNIGRSLSQFKKGIKEGQDEIDKTTDIEESKKDKDVDQELKKPG